MFQVIDKIERVEVKMAMHKSVQRRNNKSNNDFDDETEKLIELTHGLKIEHDLFSCKVRKNIPNSLVQCVDEIQIKIVTKGYYLKLKCMN